MLLKAICLITFNSLWSFYRPWVLLVILSIGCYKTRLAYEIVRGLIYCLVMYYITEFVDDVLRNNANSCLFSFLFMVVARKYAKVINVGVYFVKKFINLFNCYCVPLEQTKISLAYIKFLVTYYCCK